jgi:hypothetical protein
LGEDLGTRRRELQLGDRIVIIDLDRLYGGIWKFFFVLFLTIAFMFLVGFIVRALT